MKWTLLGCVCIVAAGCGEVPHAPPSDTRREIPTGQLGSDLTPSHYRLDLVIDPGATQFSGSVAIAVELNAPQRDLFLHGKNLHVHSANLVTDDGAIFDAIYAEVDDSGVARVRLADTAPVGPATLNITYRAPFNDALEGLYRVEEGGNAYAFTQFQASSARMVFPGFDEPVFKTPFDITVTARPDHVVITNTPERGATPAANGLVTRRFATTEPLPTYLIAFAVGPLDVVDWAAIPPSRTREQPVPLRGIAVRGKGARLAYALENTAPILSILEDYFDTPYPFSKLDIIAVPDFAAGAMENAGAITYREQLLLLNDDASLAQKRRYAVVHAHELAHMWFGDLVTPKWWDDVWLNESFAAWMADKAIDDWRPGEGYANRTLHGALTVMDDDSLVSARQIRQPIETNHDIATAFDNITYRKGAAVLAMFENFVGEDRFRDGVRLHMQRHAHGTADTDDFLRSLGDGSDNPAGAHSFSTFLYQPGVPLISASTTCADGSAMLSLTQSRYFPLGSSGSAEQLWSVPVCVVYDSGGGRSRQCTLLAGAKANVSLAGGDCPVWMMPNESSAGYYLWTLDEPALARLLENADALSDREALSLHNSLHAGFRAGKVAAATLAHGIRRAAAAKNREVATAPIRILRALYLNLVTDPVAQRGLESFVRELYGPRLNVIGLEGTSRQDDEEPTRTALLRNDLVDAMVRLGRDPELRATLVSLANAYLVGRDATPPAINPNLVELALEAAVDAGGLSFARTLLDQAVTSTDAIFRQHALTALGSSSDPRTGELMRSMILDDRLRDNEVLLIPRAQSSSPGQREAIWNWLKLNLDAMVARIPTWGRGSVVLFANGFCDATRAEEVAAFFQSRIDELAGGPRQLSQVVERIRLCAALVRAKGTELNDLFAGYAASREKTGDQAVRMH